LYFKLLKFQEERGDSEEKPEGPSDPDYEIRKYSDLLWDDFVSAARGVLDIDQIKKAFIKHFPSTLD
jgi:hypothetical protein